MSRTTHAVSDTALAMQVDLSSTTVASSPACLAASVTCLTWARSHEAALQVHPPRRHQARVQRQLSGNRRIDLAVGGRGRELEHPECRHRVTGGEQCPRLGDLAAREELLEDEPRRRRVHDPAPDHGARRRACRTGTHGTAHRAADDSDQAAREINSQVGLRIRHGSRGIVRPAPNVDGIRAARRADFDGRPKTWIGTGARGRRGGYTGGDHSISSVQGDNVGM
jgi:hypothetical protein